MYSGPLGYAITGICDALRPAKFRRRGALGKFYREATMAKSCRLPLLLFPSSAYRN
jgi:hypothetical protein